MVYRGLSQWLALLLLSLLVASCSLVATAPYDAGTDKNLTKLHKQTAQFFVAAANPIDCDYRHYFDFYQTSSVALSGLRVRAAAIGGNAYTVAQLGLLAENYASLARLHKLGCLNARQVDELWTTFDSSFSAVLRLELGKKYGR